MEIIIEALAKAQQQPAEVQVWDADPDDPLLKIPGQRRLARAVRDDEGREVIIYDRTADPKSLGPLLQHEAAHIAAWREHGESIREHGPEFMRLCRALVTERPSYYCKKD
jgi:hypothetical protein